jgi:hypothetical protein
LIRFGLALLVTTLFIVGLTWLACQLSWINSFPSFFYQTLLLLLLSTFIMYGYLSRAESSIFVQLYLLVMAVKLLAYAAYNLLMIRRDPGEAMPNVTAFMIMYLLYITVEVAFLYRKISRS